MSGETRRSFHDFIVVKDEDYRHTEFQRRRLVQFNHPSIWIVSPEDLIISKLFWSKDSLSKMQVNDIRNLRLSIKNLDNDYIDLWVQRLELTNIYAAVKSNG